MVAKKAAKGVRRNDAAALIRTTPSPLLGPPKFKEKNGVVRREGRSLFLYGSVKAGARFKRLKEELGVVGIVKPLLPESGPAPHTQIVFRTWQAAERFFGREFNSERVEDQLLEQPGNPVFLSPSMDRAFRSLLG